MDSKLKWRSHDVVVGCRPLEWLPQVRPVEPHYLWARSVRPLYWNSLNLLWNRPAASSRFAEKIFVLGILVKVSTLACSWMTSSVDVHTVVVMAVERTLWKTVRRLGLRWTCVVSHSSAAFDYSASVALVVER